MGRTQIAVTVVDNARWVRAFGDLDLTACEQLEQAVAGQDSGTAATVYVDLAGVGFMDAAGVGALVRSRNRVIGHGGTVEIVGAAGRVAELLDLLGIRRRD